MTVIKLLMIVIMIIKFIDDSDNDNEFLLHSQ